MKSPTTKPTVAPLFEDEHIIVLSKPHGIHSASLPSLSEHTSSDKTVAEWLIDYCPSCVSAAAKSEDGGLINRLDRETSGCLVAAKNRATWLALRSQLLAGRIEKTYLMLVEGNLSKPETVDAPIGSPNRRAKKVRVYERTPRKRDRALPAKTHFRPQRTVCSERASLVEALTGAARRHQIRAHAGFIGHPLVGDTLYGSSSSLEDLCSEAQDLPQFFLHAATVRFTHPVTKAEIDLLAPWPEFAASLT